VELYSRAAKAGRLNLSLLCERARNFVATNMNFQSRPQRTPNTRDARSTCRFMVGRRQAKLKPPREPLSVCFEKRADMLSTPVRSRADAANVYFTLYAERDGI
jgi:hypothetical protein